MPEQLHSGDDYEKIAPVYGLNLLCFDLYQDECYYRSFVLKDKETNVLYKQKFEIPFFIMYPIKWTRQVKGIA